MIYAVVAIVALLVVVFWWLRSRRADADEAPRQPATPRPLAADQPLPDATPAVRVDPGPLPDTLRDLPWPLADSLPAEQQASLLERLRQIPRPPRAFQQLVSPEFVARATSVELSELIMGEPTIAAQVLATVNSPLYGLQKPVVSIGQGVTFIGLNAVRSLCLRHMLEGSSESADAAVRHELDLVWTSLTLSSDLAGRLAQPLRLPDPGGLVTEVVLAHLGRIVALRLLPADVIHATWREGLPFSERTRASVQALGLPPTEVARLLMREWQLPAGVTDAVCAVDRVLVTPPPDGQDAAHARAVVAYLCTRVGERLATGRLASLGALALDDTTDTDLHHVRTALALPALARLPQLLHEPALVAAMDQMAAGLKAPVEA